MSALPTIAKLLSTTSYHDEVPVYRTATTYIDAARQFHTRAFYDGHGNEIARLRWSHDSVPVLHSFNQYDGFGRLVRSYLPKTLNISRPGLLDPQQLIPATTDPFIDLSYDSFGRELKRIAPDGRVTQFDYYPQVNWTTNPRGYTTQRRSDWRGELVHVAYFDVDHVTAIKTSSWPIAQYDLFFVADDRRALGGRIALDQLQDLALDGLAPLGLAHSAGD